MNEGTFMDKIRCEWAGTDPLYVAYHDNEWGVPVQTTSSRTDSSRNTAI